MYYINSPLEQFEVQSLFSLNSPMLGIINLTTLGLYTILVVTLLILFNYLGDNHSRLVPSKWSIALETLYSSLLSCFQSLNLNSSNSLSFLKTILFSNYFCEFNTRTIF